MSGRIFFTESGRRRQGTGQWHVPGFLRGLRAFAREVALGFRLQPQGVLEPMAPRPWASSRPDNSGAARALIQADESSVLGKLAFASLWLLVFAIPWENAIMISDFGTSARLIGMIALGLGVLAIAERGKIRRPAPGHVLMILFVMLAAVSHLWSLYPEGTLDQVFTYIQLLTMVWLIWELAPQVREQMRLMQSYLLGTLVSGIDTVYRFLSHQESVYQRYAGAGLDANDLGLIMALSIPMSYYLLIESKGWTTWLYRLQLVLAGTTILLTASRGASLATLVALSIAPLTQARLTGRQRIALLLTVSFFVCGALLFVPATSWERLSTTPGEFAQGTSTTPGEFAQGTFTGRTIIWRAGWEIFRAHPFLGIGANAFRLIVSRVLAEPIRLDQSLFLPPAPPAHNTFLSVLVEEGVIGFTLFCALLGVLAVSLRAMPPFPRRLWIVSLGVWVVGVSSLTWEMRKPTWFFFGLIMAQCGSMLRKRGAQRHAPALAEYHVNPLHAYDGEISSPTQDALL
jgi:O-antigen ligase